MFACIRDCGDTSFGEGDVVDADPLGADPLEKSFPESQVFDYEGVDRDSTAVGAPS